MKVLNKERKNRVPISFYPRDGSYKIIGVTFVSIHEPLGAKTTDKREPLPL